MKYTYSDIEFYKWMISEMEAKGNGNTAKLKDRLVEIKKAVRADNKRTSDRIIFNDDWDGCIEKFQLPDDITSKQEAKEYFKEYEYIWYKPTYYDCTGQMFTAWYKIFQKPDGSFWAYHCIGYDV